LFKFWVDRFKRLAADFADLRPRKRVWEPESGGSGRGRGLHLRNDIRRIFDGKWLSLSAFVQSFSENATRGR
jgi:hypothetical protein